MTRSKTSHLALGVFLLGYVLAWLFRIGQLSFVVEGERYFALTDDAMVSMRYAYHLAQGDGLVWNPGDRVQGYTNLGWTVWMALLHLPGLPLSVNALLVQVSNLGLTLGLLALLFVALSRRHSLRLGLLATLLVVLNAWIFNWSVLGGEQILQALLVTAAFLPFVPLERVGNRGRFQPSRGDLVRLPVLCALAFLVRPDGIVFFAIGAAVGLYTLGRMHGARGDWVAFLGSLALSALVVAGTFIWQRSFYGDWLPNTFYLKTFSGLTGVVMGLKYLRGVAFQEHGTILLLASGAVVLVGLLRRTHRAEWLPVAALLGGWLSYVAWSGGDFMRFARFVVPVAPLLCALTAYATLAVVDYRPLRRPRPTRVAALAQRVPGAVAGLSLIATSLFHLGAIYRDPDGAVASYGYVLTAVAVDLRERVAPDSGVIGVYAAGYLPYFMPGFRFHDMLGKSDARIARTEPKDHTVGHNKYDLDYSLNAVRPALIVSTSSFRSLTEESARKTLEDARQGWVCCSFRPALFLHPTFRAVYLEHEIPVHWAQQNPGHTAGDGPGIVGLFARGDDVVKAQSLHIARGSR